MDSHEAIIVGTGFGGMGAAIQLKRLGIDDFVMLEREDDLGGTWHVNRYPGLAVDIASVTYSYSFEPNPWWSHWYARGPELKKYADHVADKYDLRRHMRFGRSSRARAGTRTPRSGWSQVAGGEPVRRDVPGHRDRLPVPAAAPRHRGRGRLRRHRPALGEVGRLRRPGRQAGRGDRHRRDRGAADPRAGQAGRPPDRLPAHADLGDAQARPADAAAGAAHLRRAAVDAAAGRARSTPACSS